MPNILNPTGLDKILPSYIATATQFSTSGELDNVPKLSILQSPGVPVSHTGGNKSSITFKALNESSAIRKAVKIFLPKSIIKHSGGGKSINMTLKYNKKTHSYKCSAHMIGSKCKYNVIKLS